MPSDLKIMSARAVMSAVRPLGERFAAGHGIGISFEFAPVGALEDRLAAGEQADVVILSVAGIDAMEQAGTLVPGTRRNLGRTKVGVGVRNGAVRPDVATPDAFRQTLLAARSIAVSDPAVGGTAARYLPKLFERMGVAAQLEPKLIRCKSGGDAAQKAAGGEADICVTFISEILGVRGAAVAGALPGIYGNDTTYCGAVPAVGRDRDRAIAVLAALADPATRDVWAAAGFEPAA
jgi:molybdate transport system substrate-binding protein